MKVISLWQPWATLIAIGAKEYETRHWAVGHRGQIAIHAAKRRGRDEIDICLHQPFKADLHAAGYESFDDLPLGAVVAVGELTAIYNTEKLESKISARERAYGNYARGRFAWRLENVHRIDPIALKGHQGLFEWNPPDGFTVTTSEEYAPIQFQELTSLLRLGGQ